MVDVILYYKTYLEQSLLIISNLGKQDLILSFTWFKAYNSEIDWKKREIVMTCYSTYYSDYQNIWRLDKQQIKVLNICYFCPFTALVNNSNNIPFSFAIPSEQVEELEE